MRSATAGSARKPIAEVRDGDPHLGAGELGGERAQCALEPRRRGSPALGLLLDLAAVDGDEGELRRDEDAATAIRSKETPSRSAAVTGDPTAGSGTSDRAGRQSNCQSRPWAGAGSFARVPEAPP